MGTVYGKARLLKVGKRIGSLNLHAVVYVNGKVKMACLCEGRWMVCFEADFCSEVKRHFLNQLF